MFRVAGMAFLLAFTGAVVPGPMLALVIGQVLAQGLRAVWLILLGHALIEVLFIAALSAGLTRFLSSARVRGVLALVGGAVLVWMGSDVIVHAEQLTLSGEEGQALPALQLVLAGIGVSLSNPYFTGWWATVGSGQMGALRLTQPSRLLGFFVGHEMGDVVWYVFVSILLVAGRNWLSGGVYHALLLGCGWLILGLGVLFAVIAMRLMLKSAGDGVPTPFRESGTVGEGV